MDFGSQRANSAWEKRDPTELSAALKEAGWIPASERDYAGAPSIRMMRGCEVVVDRHLSTSPFVLLLTTRAVITENLGGDSIRDGDAGSRMVTPPKRVVYELDLTPEEQAEVGL